MGVSEKQETSSTPTKEVIVNAYYSLELARIVIKSDMIGTRLLQNTSILQLLIITQPNVCTLIFLSAIQEIRLIWEFHGSRA